MRGIDVTPLVSPAHRLFEVAPRWSPPVTTIGIGDGGNEIGMGKIPWQVIRRNIPRGGLVACRVPADHLIVCGVSNWGAYGLGAGVRLLRGAGPEAELFYARAAVLHAARAAGLDAFDVAYGDVNDMAGFLREVMIAKNLGFNGKSLIHPSQIETANRLFGPSAEEVDEARRLIAAATTWPPLSNSPPRHRDIRRCAA